MNARIKELALQAGFTTQHGGKLYSPKLEDVPITDNIEKFAELIVQECIDIISPYSFRMGGLGERGLHPIQEIEQNFGIKE